MIGRGGGDFGADQQCAGRLDRHTDQDRNLPLPASAKARFAPLTAALICSGSWQVSIRDRVDAAGEQPGALDRQRVFDLLIGDMAERRQPRPRPERAEDEAGPAVMRKLGDRLLRQLGGAAVQLERLVGDAELAQGDRRTTEAVGLQRVAAGREIAAMDFADEVRAAFVEDLGAVLMALEIALDVEIAGLHLRAHRAVAQQHAVGEIVEEMGHRVS